MGLFDRFRRKPGESEGGDKSFYLDADKSSSLGDVDFMRRSNTIRHTFPGTVDNPGMKERFEDVATSSKRSFIPGLSTVPGKVWRMVLERRMKSTSPRLLDLSASR